MTTDIGPEPAAQPAMEALLDFAAHTRPDINRADLQGALLHAYEAGCPWGWTLVTTAQVLARGEDTYDLRNAIDAWRRTRTGKPTP